VLFTGDLFFPAGDFFIHYSGGGTLAGMIRAADRFLALVNEETLIVPGHSDWRDGGSPICKRADLASGRAFLVTIRDRIQGLIAKGQDVERVVRADPLRDLFIDSANPPTSLWARLVYQELARTQAR
jgi:glyoxylase-like metal-dependent hydrolase (beta-lactamase superfamily II)